MENGSGEKPEVESEPIPETQQLCRFFSQGRHCNFGKKCKFLHIRNDVIAAETPSHLDAAPLNSQGAGEHGGHRPQLTHNPRLAPAAGRRPCRYFLSGHCTMEDRCRFWHPPQLPLGENPSVPVSQTRNTPRAPPVSRPCGLQEVKMCDMTEDMAKQLRDTEIRQLKKRFPKDNLIIQERSDGKVTCYRAAVEATDPDWVALPLTF